MVSIHFSIPDALQSKLAGIAEGTIPLQEGEFHSLKEWKVFTHKEFPQYIIKMAKKDQGRDFDEMEERYSNSLLARKVCEEKNLDLIVIPKTEKLTVGEEVLFVVEERMDINHTETGQLDLYSKLSSELDKTVEQIAIFIGETGFFDVSPRNIPLINEAEGFLGTRRVAMIDLEHRDLTNVKLAFSGGFDFYHGYMMHCAGLVHCLFFEQHLEKIIEVAKRYKVDVKKDFRLGEVKSYRELQKYYEDKGIKTGKEPLQVDIDSLGLDSDVRTVAEAVVREINNQIQQKDDQESVIGKRKILANFRFADRGVVVQILQAMQDHGVIREFDESNRGISLQV